MHFHLRPGGAACAGHIQRVDPRLIQPPGCLCRQAPTNLLDDDRHAQPCPQVGDLIGQAAEIPVAFGLERLLQRVEVQHERIGLDHLHRPTACVDPITSVELHRTQVSKQQNTRRITPHLEGLRQVMILNRRPLRPDPHCQPDRLRGQRQVAVDRRRPIGTPRHRRDQHRRAHLHAKQGLARFDLGERHLGQRLVDEAVGFQSGRQPGGNVLFQVDLDVFAFSVGGVRVFFHLRVLINGRRRLSLDSLARLVRI